MLKPPDENLEEAADIFLKLGDIKEYCEIMIKLDKWENALAIAPARSLGYWAELTKRYSKVLMQDKQPSAVHFLLATGNASEAVDYQSKSLKDLDGALLVAAGEAVDALPQTNDEVDDMGEAKPIEGEREDVDISENVKKVTHMLALKARKEGSPVKAACYYMAIGDVPKAIQILVLGAEVPLALAISRMFEEEADYVHLAMANTFELEGLFHEALMCTQQIADPTTESMLLAARYVGNNHYRADFYNKAGLDTKEEILALGNKQLEEGNTVAAILNLVVGKDNARALEYGVEYLQDQLAKGVYDFKELKSVMSALECVDIVHVKTEIRASVIALSFYFALQEACWRGYTQIIPFLANSIVKLVEEHDINIGVPVTQVRFQLASYLASVDPVVASQIVEEVAADKDTPPKVKAACNPLLANIQTIKETYTTAEGIFHSPTEITEHQITPSGAQLPSGNPMNQSLISVVSGKAIQNGGYMLLEDFKQYVAEDEFIMLCKVTPYSALLDGQRAHRFPPQDTTSQ